MTGFDELQPRDEALARSLREGLRQREASLDLTVTTRLRAARAKAIDTPSAPVRHTNWLVASGGFATAAAVALLLVMRPPLPGPTSAPEGAAKATRAEAIDVLTDDVDAEFYEDLDLYRWLDRGRDGAA